MLHYRVIQETINKFISMDNVKPFMGIGWEHEFNGKAKSFAGNLAVDPPSLKGDTGILELGLKTNN